MRRALLDDVHRIVDHLAETLGRSVMLDDPDLALLAGSRHFGDEDPYRVSVVLARGAGPEAVEWFRRFDLATADGPVRVPGHEALGLRPRLCYPVRCNGVHLGALWLMDDGRPLDEDLVRDACLRLGRILAERGHTGVLDEPLVDALLVQLVRGVDPDHVLDLLRAERFVDAGRRYEVTVAHPALTDGRTRLTDLAHRAARAERVVDHRVIAVEEFPVLVGAVRRSTPPADPPEGPVALGTSDVGEVEDLRELFVQAALAAFAAHHLRAGGSTRWSDLGPLAAFLRAAAVPVRTPALARFEELLDADRAGTAGATVAAYLRHAGDTTATATELVVHRTTLRYRLEQVESRTGLDLADGRDRAAVQLALLARDVRVSGVAPFLRGEH
ncbi:helix-turn-helix domain-containing protein [Kineococcus sp. LSe6-4]|uniref:Helix-turn-helix domain-containing protein n=1 Tax=Kineococcus halophytocola TaxID=3234027 RepID=A0ABV4H5E3_9ACTN